MMPTAAVVPVVMLVVVLRRGVLVEVPGLVPFPVVDGPVRRLQDQPHSLVRRRVCARADAVQVRQDPSICSRIVTASAAAMKGVPATSTITGDE